MALVTVVVLGVAGFAMYRLNGTFAAAHRTSAVSGISNEIIPFNPKQMVLEVFGTPGSAATINYLDVDAQPQQVLDATLPWSYTITTTEPAVMGNLVAQGDGDFIGCRITVNGVITDERSTNNVDGFIACLDKSA